jgi:hypothetical protein
MDPMIAQMQAFHRLGVERPPSSWRAIGGALAITVALLLLLVSMPRFADRGDGDALQAPGPLPAPAPVISADFPEQAQPGGGCYAILNMSSATSAPRADRAEDQTGPLFVDACFGA